MKKLFFLLVMCLTALTMQAQLKNEYVDLGLPSGTKWKTKNEAGGFYDWESAKKKFGDNLPTNEQWQELKEYCEWTWTGKGFKVIGDNGNSITLPAEGYSHFRRGVIRVGSEGRYWSSTPVGVDYAGRLHIDSTHVNVRVDMRKNGLSVRLVKK